MKRLIPAVAALLATGCASIFSGTTQDISIRTTPGARYTITDSYGKQAGSGITEGTASVERGVGYFSPHAYKARITKDGYQAKTIDITPGMNPWYFANILIGGVVGMLIVDPLTGAMYKFYPSEIDAQLELDSNTQPTASAAPTRLQPVTKPGRPVAYSTHEYAATERAKAQGCKPTDSPSFDGIKTPHETLIFQCTDGRSLIVTCDSQSGCS